MAVVPLWPVVAFGLALLCGLVWQVRIYLKK